MNHGPDFQALWARLRSEVRELQVRGYYGDGYWSSGQRLADSARISGDGAITTDELPEYLVNRFKDHQITIEANQIVSAEVRKLENDPHLGAEDAEILLKRDHLITRAHRRHASVKQEDAPWAPISLPAREQLSMPDLRVTRRLMGRDLGNELLGKDSRFTWKTRP
jgi:hypothetical protein